ncbi:MAG TPA: Holliday junction resolvase RuvX [Patescibacteria group bacterium]|nr:Holliday junction resolvase RuvX [Patescibacteria group bacterium]
MRILGIDYGGARVGVALGDTETRVASPWRVIANEREDETLERLREIARQEHVEKFVIGIPYPLGDQSRETDQAKEIRVFSQKLRIVGLPVEEQNETWSSRSAKIQAREMGERRKRDDLAAAVILQAYLDAQAE